MGGGTGQGNIDLDSELKHGQPNKLRGRHIGGVTIDRFETLPRDMQDPDHIVLPFPQGGIDTRFLDKYARRHSQQTI
jgi:hypothetical protein